jgi:hypothetical protein
MCYAGKDGAQFVEDLPHLGNRRWIALKHGFDLVNGNACAERQFKAVIIKPWSAPRLGSVAL